MNEGEFDLIARYIKPLTMGRQEALGLADDGAVLSIPEGFQIVISSDVLNEGVHFLDHEAPENIAKKALRVNLSDLAAMGAKPLAYQLTLALGRNHTHEKWLKSFSAALLEDQQQFNIFCSGGDTTRTEGPLSISITAMGLVPEGKAIKRSGARDGDFILLTGPVGDAYIGLHMLQGKIKGPNGPYFTQRLHRPSPRVQAYEAMQRYAHAAIDISDGVLADLRHVCAVSHIGAEIHITDAMFSAEARQMIRASGTSAQELLTGGDDYELLIAVAPDDEPALRAALSDHGIQALHIGRFTHDRESVAVIDEHKELVFSGPTGWSHF